MSDDMVKIIRLSFQSPNLTKIKSLEERLVGPSKNGHLPIFSYTEELKLNSSPAKERK